MLLPKSVRFCMDALEQAGFQAYAVGGCVRDDLMGIEPHDYDLCTDALPEQTQQVFAAMLLSLAGVQHGTVVVHTEDGEIEITTYRQEGPYSDGRRPDWVRFVPDIDQDLARRDFTVNAIAYSPTRGYADPFGGREDLKDGLLRMVGDPVLRFREDSLRILRGIRFCARFHMTVEAATEDAMRSEAWCLDTLARERVFDELSRALPLLTTRELILFAPVLARLIPELEPMIDFDQCSPHHAYDLITHTACVVQGVPGDVTLRWAALLHDIGKVPTFRKDETGRGHFKRHAPVGGEMADIVLRRLKAPAKLREEVVWLITNHMTEIPEEEPAVRRMLTRYRMETLRRLVYLQRSDMSSKGMGEDDRAEHFDAVFSTLNRIEKAGYLTGPKDLAVNGSDLIALGLSGKAIGLCQNDLLEAVLEGTLPNTRDALLQQAAAWKPSVSPLHS